jgi:hypothetical protein
MHTIKISIASEYLFKADFTGILDSIAKHDCRDYGGYYKGDEILKALGQHYYSGMSDYMQQFIF